MRIEELIHQKITNIYSSVKMEVGGIDSGECYLEIDNEMIIHIPFAFDDNLSLKVLDKDATSLFADFSDYPVYYLNNETKTAGEYVDNFQLRKPTFFNRLRNKLFGHEIAKKDHQSFKVDYKENRLKNIKNRKIIDFLWYADESEKSFILLDNGYLITEINIAPHGTGLVGLHLYENLNDMINAKGKNYFKLTDQKGIH